MASFKFLPAGLTLFSSHPHSKNHMPPTSRPHPSLVSYSLRFRQESLGNVKLEFESKSDSCLEESKSPAVDEDVKKPEEENLERGGAEEKGISGIHVPRQKYISVPKAELLDAILSEFESKQDADEFVRLSACLDAILHAEHKGMLEEMRSYYSFSRSQKENRSPVSSSPRSDGSMAFESEPHLPREHSVESENMKADHRMNVEVTKAPWSQNSLDLRNLFRPSTAAAMNPVDESRVAVATHFQRIFMQLLRDAQFEELSAQDLMLTYKLNSDYLLTLPIYVDWKKASESKAIIFRRGYATERQKGLLIGEKLDYLQSKLLQKIFFSLSLPLERIGRWINEVLLSSSEAADSQIWIAKVKLWLKEHYSLESTWSYIESKSGSQLETDELAASDLPLWLAAQRAVPRYEGFLSSIGPRGRLIRKLLMWIGIIPSMSEGSYDIDKTFNKSDNYLRPTFLPRITLGNLWEPATRESCGNNPWKMFKTAISILFSKSTLQEPAFEELILLYADEVSQTETDGKGEVLPLQLKIYERIPIPDLPVIFPHKKLSFRILDTVRLDVASILGLLAYVVNYKFENIVSSPSAALLDVIAISALVVYVFRVALGYKQTRDRYQLLVNRTLYEKTLASGFGSVYFLLDASEQQQYKEAILVYAVLHLENYQVSCRKSIQEACERFLYDQFKEKIEMPVDKAVDTLLRLNLVTESPENEMLELKALPLSEVCQNLKKRWDDLLGKHT